MSNSLDLMNRMGLVNEDSINAKQRNIKRVENAFNNGVSNYIRCFAVLTAENPDSKKASNAYNKKANKELFKALKTQYTTINRVIFYIKKRGLCYERGNIL